MKEKKNPKRIVLLAAAVLVVVLFLNIWRVFRFTSDLTRDAGRYHLESVSGDFESTIDDAQRLAKSLGIQAHPYLGDPNVTGGTEVGTPVPPPVTSSSADAAVVG